MPIDQEDLASQLRQLLGLGPVPAARGEVVSETIEDRWVRTELRLSGNPATYLRPHGAERELPAIVYCHAHGGEYDLGRKELTTGAWWLHAPFAPDLVAAGFAVLCLDMPGFGDRRDEGSEGQLVKAALWRGHPLFGQMLADQIGAVGWLREQQGVDTDHVATLGLSMGAAHAYWVGALDERVSAVVQMCMLADMGPMIDCGAYDRHGHYLTVPGLLPIADMGDVAALIAPRHQFVAHGETDLLTPAIARDPALEKLRNGYARAGGQLETYFAAGSGHADTAGMREAVLNFLIDWAASPVSRSDFVRT